MKLVFDNEEALFSVKCLIAALLSFYLASSIGLPHPYLGVTTSFATGQALSGASLSKSMFRLIGTLLGGGVAVVLLPTFVNEPLVLAAALAAWLGLCVYFALLDRTPRAYAFLLAGYTTSFIGFPNVDQPGAIFDVASLRVQEISIGILASGLVHSFVFPRTVAKALVGQAGAALELAERWSLACLSGAGEGWEELARLTTALNELDQLAIHLSFDTDRRTPSRRTVHAFQDKLALILPLGSTIDDRLAEIRRMPGGAPAPITRLVERVSDWLRQGAGRREAVSLIEEARSLERLGAGGSIWREMLVLNFLERLQMLIAAHNDCRLLCEQIRRPSWRDGLAELLYGAPQRARHLDPGLALRAAAGTAAAILLGSLFWIATGWKDGGQALSIAAAVCALYASAADAPAAAFRFVIGSAAGVACAILYGFVVLPRATDYVTVAAALAPAFLLLGSMLARPSMASVSAGAMIALPTTVGLNLSYNSDFAGALNTALALLIGAAFAVVMLALFQTDNAVSVARLRRACFRAIARRAGGNFDHAHEWLSEMLDRVSLLSPKLARLGGDAGGTLLDALRKVRIGYVAGELGALSLEASALEQERIARSLSGVRRYFDGLASTDPKVPPPELLSDIDGAVAAFAADPVPERRRQGLVLLTGLRRNLFPLARPYDGAVA